MSLTIGDFLRHKMGNMARWVSDEVGKENLPVDVVQLVDGSRGVELVYFAELLAEHRGAVTHRDWRKLLALIENEKAPVWVMTLAMAVRAREAMHDKFWRYLELFRDTVSSDETEEEELLVVDAPEAAE